MSEPEDKKYVVEIPFEWALKKFFGPILEEYGEELKRWHVARRLNKIADAATRKVENLEDGRQPNLNVTHNIFMNGAFRDDEVSAEYFGGILASSRSEDGKDDSTIHYVDVIKSLSSRQLHLHYLIYNGLNKIFVAKKDQVNVAQGSEIESREIWLASLELDTIHKIDILTDFNILNRQGLIKQYKFDIEKKSVYQFPYSMAKPTTFSVMLYAVAHNRKDLWHSFPSVPFGAFETVPSLLFFADSLDELRKLCGVPSS